ncbi:transposase [bacterium]|nr:transposase [bacterium]MBU1626972.1 transposase [bacterium]
MAKVYRLPSLFDLYNFNWKQLNGTGDLERLKMVFEVLQDEELMLKLEAERKGRRDDYPIRPVWNSIIAGIVFQHKSIESLRRELLRNGELRMVCGFELLNGADAVPSKDAYSLMSKKLLNHQDDIDSMFDKIVEEIRQVLPDFGKNTAVDSKAIRSECNGKNKRNDKDNRGDADADWGKKVYHGKREDGTLWEKITSWFGYKVHLLVDTTYELPISYEVTKASVPDIKQLMPLVEKAKNTHPSLQIEILTGDKGYDSKEEIVKLWDNHKIKPVIDIRNMWKDKEETHALKSDKVDNIAYNYKGCVYCYDMNTAEKKELAFNGFEKDRDSLKYLCPAKAYGMECKGKELCGEKGYGRIVRIPLETDRRIFTPIARSSYKWEKAYKSRTAVERVNSRIDGSFMFEHHYIRGQAKMKMRMGMALLVMVCMALARIRMNQKEMMRSLVKRPLPKEKAA